MMALQTKDYSVTAKSSNDNVTYTYILRVTENSINQDANTSNVTVQAIVKCTYPSATTSTIVMQDMTMVVTCTLNGEQKIYSSEQRTMYGGNKENELDTWTGDVAHNIDGSLALTVGGSLSHSSSKEWMPTTPMTIEEDAANAMDLTFIERGVVYIDNGSGFEAYQCYIDNGTSWDLYMPYIDNGAGWDLCN